MVDFDDKLEHLSAQELTFRDGGGANSVTSLAYSKAPYAPARKPRRDRITRGGIPKSAAQAWVYVATDDDGFVKVGISSNVPVRMRGLRAQLRLALEVSPSAAQDIETEAFQLLGHDLATGEWLGRDLPAAMVAVWNAYTSAVRRDCVLPGLSPDDARILRIALAKQKGLC
jgi:hypothetical protein